ncbi:hypothetical protein [Flavobacterium sp. B183]|uniref:hypothetical protein n=1 Tax=Flavobacterium sp. B183 TaxID=907046 RepID=UPI00201F0133|nr:hypothetical protein [Flavobacterium sp. B183]URC13532.1 hypothetical protein M4I44_03825 [Flavobacterium sp. B183]
MKTTVKNLIEKANKSLLVLVLLLLTFNLSHAQGNVISYQNLIYDTNDNYTNDANWMFTVDDNNNESNRSRTFSWFVRGGNSNDDLMMYLTNIPNSGNELRLFGKSVLQSASWAADWDNLTTWVDGFSSFIQSNGDENGLKISSNTGNKIYIGDNNDNVFFPGNNVGFGIDSPQFKVHANGAIVSENNGVQVKLSSNTNNTDGWIGTSSNHGLYVGTNKRATNMYLDTSDNVYIGGVMPGDIKASMRGSYDLFVHNGILTEDYGIGPKATWADYVFNDTYKLKTLKEIDEFISVNKHLPNIPSQKSIAENGYNLHEMNVKLLEKIEELMLYTINQQKELDKIKEDYKGLKNSIRNLEIKHQ